MHAAGVEPSIVKNTARAASAALASATPRSRPVPELEGKRACVTLAVSRPPGRVRDCESRCACEARVCVCVCARARAGNTAESLAPAMRLVGRPAFWAVGSDSDPGRPDAIPDLDRPTGSWGPCMNPPRQDQS